MRVAVKSTSVWRAGLLALGLICASAGEAADTPSPLATYGDLPGIEQVSISPSGLGIAIIGRMDGARFARAVRAFDAATTSLRWWDLTDYVVPEDGPTTIGLGANRRWSQL